MRVTHVAATKTARGKGVGRVGLGASKEGNFRALLGDETLRVDDCTLRPGTPAGEGEYTAVLERG